MLGIAGELGTQCENSQGQPSVFHCQDQKTVGARGSWYVFPNEETLSFTAPNTPSYLP